MLNRIIFLWTLFTCAISLEWQDCNLQADHAELNILKYQHIPDPEVTTQNHSIVKSFQYSGLTNVNVFNEYVKIDRSFVAPTDPSFVSWEPYFENTFDICTNHEICPIAPGTEFTIQDDHGPSNSDPAWFRAVEYFYNDKVWIGCLTTVYQTV